MSKISEYLSEHILGEVTSSKPILEKFSRDGSVLSLKPEIVIFPRNTGDLRKIARFSWQLAEKGHVLPLTARGFGGDSTGASIGSGIIINTTAHLSKILNFPVRDKDKIIHVQPGVSCSTLAEVLSWHGLSVPTLPMSSSYSTVGGVLANNSRGPLSGKYGGIDEWVEKLEVVLANGDIIETGRISKKELSKKIGSQNFEGEIYRKLDGIIEDYETHINRELADNPYGNSGYGNIVDVKRSDGSFDLTPLFLGSQGTLGIISEVILKTEFINNKPSKLLIVTKNVDEARDICDELVKIELSQLEILDGRLYDSARQQGKQYPFFNRPNDDFNLGAVIYLEIDDFKDHSRSKKIKKIQKILQNFDSELLTEENSMDGEIEAIREVMGSLLMTEEPGTSRPPILDGAQIPTNRIEEFLLELNKLEAKHHCELPFIIRVLDETIYLRTNLELHKVTDKQKLFKLISDYATIVDSCKGVFIVDSAEGRLKANASLSVMDDTSKRLFEEIRAVFDPYSTLNPGVKQQVSFKYLVGMLQESYDVSDRAHLAPNS
jgi:FAD/FMN-containing dehydrogenase